MQDKRFLKNIHYFRAFAIINIAMIHIWHIPLKYQKYSGVKFINVIREVFFHDSTIYFVFISGFLFYYLSSNFDTLKYYKKKLMYVICPYIFMTLFILLTRNISSIIDNKYSVVSFLNNFAKSLLKGNAQVQYWYIPFIFVVFLISSLLLKVPKNIFKRIVLFGFFIPLLGTRTGINVTLFQFLYFLPIYLLGIYVAMEYEKIILLINKYKILLFITAIISTIFLFILEGKKHLIGLINITELFFYIQKISISFLCLILFKKIEHKDYRFLNYFATYSFAIYFLHTWIGENFLRAHFYNFVFLKIPEFIMPLSFLYSVVFSFVTLLVSILIKKVLKNKSRYFIGV